MFPPLCQIASSFICFSGFGAHLCSGFGPHLCFHVHSRFGHHPHLSFHLCSGFGPTLCLRLGGALSLLLQRGLLLAGPRQAAQTHVQGSRILQEILFLLSFQLSTCTGVSSGRVRRLGFLQTLSFCLQPQSSKRQSSKPFGNRR